MKYQVFVFEKDCPSNAFSDNEYTFNKFIKQRERLMVTSTIDQVYTFECENFSDFRNMVSDATGEVIDYDNDMLYIIKSLL